MNRRVVFLFAVIKFASGATVGAHLLQETLAKNQAERWARESGRQLFAAVDSVLLQQARSVSGSDPVAWAAALLSVQPGGTVTSWKVSKLVEAPAANSESSERVRWDSNTVVYERLLRPSEGVGVRVNFPQSSFPGLTSQARLVRDAISLVVGVLAALAAYAWVGRRLRIFHFDPIRNDLLLWLPKAQNANRIQTEQFSQLVGLLKQLDHPGFTPEVRAEISRAQAHAVALESTSRFSEKGIEELRKRAS